MRALAFLVLVAATTAACAPREPRERQLRLNSANYAFTVIPSQSPPYAREATLYRIVVLDRKTREPIETGEGQIYANNIERASTWDGFQKAAEVGTYFGKLNFLTAGTWAVAIRFRRDSLHRLETIEWVQEVANERDASTP